MSIMELTDDEANNISIAKHLLRMMADLSTPVENKKALREIDSESLAVYARTVEELLPARF
ncbi:MAG: hypothetical protein PHU14_00150 [Methylovulum sp.]|nr:hypothetical protein [Methylovulum sp.]